MTQLKFWFQSQAPRDRKKFIDEMVYQSGQSRKTIYNYLTNQPPKLTGYVIASLAGMQVEDLYKQVKTL